MVHRMTFLFVCVHNAGRSQMAAALLNHQDGVYFRGISAGTAPADQVNPTVVEAMKEIGIDLSQVKPQPLTPELIASADRIISMGCNIAESCPTQLGLRIDEEWGIADPAGKSIEDVRAIRDEISEKIKLLLRTA